MHKHKKLWITLWLYNIQNHKYMKTAVDAMGILCILIGLYWPNQTLSDQWLFEFFWAFLYFLVKTYYAGMI